ncbi:hypothetical protein D918_02066 [Trichuris suis]|nr:hypothetical protein D918_02066 [Trichuris suis]
MTTCRLSVLMLRICGILIVTDMLMVQCGNRETPNKEERTVAYSANETDSESEEELDQLELQPSLMNNAIEDAMQTIKMLLSTLLSHEFNSSRTNDTHPRRSMC